MPLAEYCPSGTGIDVEVQISGKEFERRAGGRLGFWPGCTQCNCNLEIMMRFLDFFYYAVPRSLMEIEICLNLMGNNTVEVG